MRKRTTRRLTFWAYGEGRLLRQPIKAHELIRENSPKVRVFCWTIAAKGEKIMKFWELTADIANYLIKKTEDDIFRMQQRREVNMILEAYFGIHGCLEIYK